jgi:hypothetical protein
MNSIIRCPNEFFYTKDTNIYIDSEFFLYRLVIKINKPNNDCAKEKRKYIELPFSSIKEKQIILRYLFFLNVFVPKNGYLMHNYDYDYEVEDYPTELLSIYTDIFYFDGSIEKFKNMCDEILQKLPLCLHFISDNENLFFSDEYLLIHKFCIKCKNKNKNKNKNKEKNTNPIDVKKYYNCVYEIFKTQFNCPYEITELILDNLHFEDIFINKELLDLNILKIL